MSTHNLPKVESLIAWSAQHGYCFAKDAAAEYGSRFGRCMHDDENTATYGTQSWSDGIQQPLNATFPQDRLEALVDAYGVREVLAQFADIAYGKSEHAADSWSKLGRKLGTIIDWSREVMGEDNAA